MSEIWRELRALRYTISMWACLAFAYYEGTHGTDILSMLWIGLAGVFVFLGSRY